VERARIVLAVADGAGTSGTARLLDVSRPTVIKWRDRFAAHGIAGLDDEQRSGRPKVVDDSAIIAATLEPPPAKLGVTHWSLRLLGKHLGIGDATVARAWRNYHVKPWRRETFKFSTDPELEAKVRDVVGRYVNPPEKAIVVCVDEKSQIQALNRTAPILPLRPGLPEKATHDYKRNGTTTLFAALEVATGRVTDQCYDRHGKAEFLDFLKKVAKAYPRRELHVVLDNYHTYKHDDINIWLAKNPRFKGGVGAKAIVVTGQAIPVQLRGGCAGARWLAVAVGSQGSSGSASVISLLEPGWARTWTGLAGLGEEAFAAARLRAGQGGGVAADGPVVASGSRAVF